MKKILVVVDMQNDFLTGTLANESAVNVIPNIIREIKSGNYDTIVFTRDTHDENYLNTQEGKTLPVKHCIEGTWGWNVCDELIESTKTTPTFFIDKLTFGFKNWIYLSEYIDDIENAEFTFTGTCTDICVVSNALAIKATYPEAKVNCIANCCAPLFGSEEKQNSALSVMESCQVNIIR